MSTLSVKGRISKAEISSIIRAYLETWAMETGTFFDGLDASSTDDAILAVARSFPVFRVDIR